MGTGSSRSSTTPPISTLSPLHPDIMVSPRTTSPRKASMSSSTTWMGSPSGTPRLSLSGEAGKGPLSHRLVHKMKRLVIHPHPSSSMKQDYSSPMICDDTYPESPQYRQFRSNDRSHSISKSKSTTSPLILSGPIEQHARLGDSPLYVSQPIITSTVSRTIQITPIQLLTPSYSPFPSPLSTSSYHEWMSLEWILSTRSATHGLFDAYPYHCFDGFLVRTAPTYRPCLDFLHGESQFREKWTGFQPHPSHHPNSQWKWNIMINEARTLYHTYILPISSFLSHDIQSRFIDIGLTTVSSTPTEDEIKDMIPFFHSDMFHDAVYEIMEQLKAGPFAIFVETQQWKEMGS